METLLDILKKETQSLKEQYIALTKEWAEKEFDHLRQWARDYQLGKFGFGVASKKYYRLPNYILNRNGKVEQHIEKKEKEAIEHYENSIEKLAARIEKKGLDIARLKTVTAHVGVNIETVLTDGTKTVRAFTIIASGEVQRPHYRYLIK
jgi:hypothetical protein